MKDRYTFCIVGGGFYGCCLALWLKATAGSVLLLEKETSLMSRASAINQARVHTGFHYPRSLATAIRSLVNCPRFVFEFRKAIVDDFIMLYAIAKHGSKVNAKRFWRMYTEMKAPIEAATPNQKALFNPSMVEDVFAVREYAFDHDILREQLASRLEANGIDVALSTEALSARQDDGEVVVTTTNGEVRAKHVFNITYSRINRFLQASGEALLDLKHEITELALVHQSEFLVGQAVTVMDGPFFSLMPYPSRKCYSLSHVRYTPHDYWRDTTPCLDAHALLAQRPLKSAFPYMERDVRRFMPHLDLHYEDSLYEVKTVLSRNETDDGRPILFKQHPRLGEVYTVMGSKLDNVYDLFEGMQHIVRPFAQSENLWQTILGVGE